MGEVAAAAAALTMAKLSFDITKILYITNGTRLNTGIQLCDEAYRLLNDASVIKYMTGAQITALGASLIDLQRIGADLKLNRTNFSYKEMRQKAKEFKRTAYALKFDIQETSLRQNIDAEVRKRLVQSLDNLNASTDTFLSCLPDSEFNRS